MNWLVGPILAFTNLLRDRGWLHSDFAERVIYALGYCASAAILGYNCVAAWYIFAGAFAGMAFISHGFYFGLNDTPWQQRPNQQDWLAPVLNSMGLHKESTHESNQYLYALFGTIAISFIRSWLITAPMASAHPKDALALLFFGTLIWPWCLAWGEFGRKRGMKLPKIAVAAFAASLQFGIVWGLIGNN